MLRFQHERACIGKAGQTGIVRCSLSRKHARSPSGRPRFCLAAALSLLPRVSQRRQKALRAVLVETVAHRAALPYTIGIPFAYDLGLACCRWKRSPIHRLTNRARAVARYDDVASTLVHGLEYSDRLDPSPMMGRWMARAGDELLADADALVPVPLHWRWTRRYSQSVVLARTISAICGVPIAHGGLKRIRATPQQDGRSRTERADNVQRAFLVPPEHRVEIAGRRLVLVDDVLTSGATVDACTRTLLRAGAAQVDVLVFARVVAPARSPI